MKGDEAEEGLLSRTNFCTTDRVSLSNGAYPKVGKALYLLALATLGNRRKHKINIRSMDQKLSNVLTEPDESA